MEPYILQDNTVPESKSAWQREITAAKKAGLRKKADHNAKLKAEAKLSAKRKLKVKPEPVTVLAHELVAHEPLAHEPLAHENDSSPFHANSAASLSCGGSPVSLQLISAASPSFGGSPFSPRSAPSQVSELSAFSTIEPSLPF